MSKRSISKKEIPTPEKGIRKKEKEDIYIASIFWLTVQTSGGLL